MYFIVLKLVLSDKGAIDNNVKSRPYQIWYDNTEGIILMNFLD